MSQDLPKIAILGYGAMGKVIETLAKDKGYEITDIFDQDNPLQKDADYDFDVAIDFTLPDSVIENVRILSEKNKSVVVGTTGWYDQIDDVVEIVNNNNTGLVWGSNFSVGVQMYFKIVDYASKLVNKVDNYDIFVHEMHHKRKKDSPSGTAETISDIIIENVDRKASKEIETIHGEVDSSKLHVTSSRGGEVTGTHSVYLDSLADAIEVTHRAKNRTGFALGSLLAANWIKDKKGFYSFKDIMQNIWKNIDL